MYACLHNRKENTVNCMTDWGLLQKLEVNIRYKNPTFSIYKNTTPIKS